jgi:hypothetical protein
MSRGPFDRPLDRALMALRLRWPAEHVYIWHPDKLDTWLCRCPVCAVEGVWTLEIVEPWKGGDIELSCWSGCHEGLVRLALGVPSAARAELVRGRTNGSRAIQVRQAA